VSKCHLSLKFLSLRFEHNFLTYLALLEQILSRIILFEYVFSEQLNTPNMQFIILGK
jgi:hypothetical protein